MTYEQLKEIANEYASFDYGYEMSSWAEKYGQDLITALTEARAENQRLQGREKELVECLKRDVKHKQAVLIAELEAEVERLKPYESEYAARHAGPLNNPEAFTTETVTDVTGDEADYIHAVAVSCDEEREI